MASLMAVTRLLEAGDELLVGDDIYGGMHRLVMNSTQKQGVKVKLVDTTNLKSLEAAITKKTKLLHMESPSNPLMKITDIRAVSKLLHKHNVLLSVDSTMMPPVLSRPLTLGADIVVHSLTKFFSGHADVMGGAVCVKSGELAKRIAFYQNAEGTALAPFDCWVILRGIKTMHVRVERAQANANKIAEFLQKHKSVKYVYYAGLKPLDKDPQLRKDYFNIHKNQSEGGGCVLSFVTGDVGLSQ
eukprot:UN24653